MIHALASSSPRRPVRIAAVSMAVIALVGGLGVAAYAKSKGNGDQVVTQFLATTNQDPDGTAVATWTDKGDDELAFKVELEHLPTGTYDLYVTDVVTPKGSITVDVNGHGEIEFASPLDDPKPLFDFAVIDKIVEIRQGATVFFTDIFVATGGSSLGDGDKTKSEVNFVNVNAATDFDAHGSLKYEASKSKVKLTLKVEKLDPGTYTILAGGVAVGEVTTVDSSEVEVVFQDPVAENTTLLGFDPLGVKIDLAKNNVVFLTALLPAANVDSDVKAPSSAKKAAKDLGKSKSDSLQVTLLNLGVAAGVQGTATLTQSSTESEFQVEIEDATVGNYDVFVAGVLKGTIATDSTGAGALHFSTDPGVGETLFDFPVKGQIVDVRSGTDVVLGTVFPISVQAALGSFKKETHKTNKATVNLVNTGVDLDATGTVAWKLKGNGDQEVTFDVKDLPAGDYNIVVNDVASASKLTESDKGKGKLTFATVAKGSKVLLDFNPVDAVIKITDSNDILLLQAVIDVP